jgi:hypothetical protein
MKFAKRILATRALVTVVVQVNASETQELAGASQNPVGNIISLPFEYNYRASTTQRSPVELRIGPYSFSSNSSLPKVS